MLDKWFRPATPGLWPEGSWQDKECRRLARESFEKRLRTYEVDRSQIRPSNFDAKGIHQVAETYFGNCRPGKQWENRRVVYQEILIKHSDDEQALVTVWEALLLEWQLEYFNQIGKIETDEYLVNTSGLIKDMADMYRILLPFKRSR
jgi:hypothetical protein